MRLFKMEGVSRRAQLIGAVLILLILVAVVGYVLNNHKLRRTYASQSGGFSIKVPLGYSSSDGNLAGIPVLSLDERMGSGHIVISVLSVPDTVTGEYGQNYEVSNSDLKLVGTSCKDSMDASCAITYVIEKDKEKELRFLRVFGNDWEVAKSALESFRLTK